MGIQGVLEDVLFCREIPYNLLSVSKMQRSFLIGLLLWAVFFLGSSFFLMLSPQSWVVFGILLNTINQSLVMSFAFCLLPALKAGESTIKVDLDTASWLASCWGIAMLLGLLWASFFVDVYGRRETNAVVLLPGMAGWLLIYFSRNVTMLIVGRLIGGFSCSISFVLGFLIVGEYTSPEYRGLFLNLKTTFLCVGNLTMHVIGTFFDWRTVALLSLIPLVTSFFISCTFPESPMWLASRKKFKESEAAFFWLRGTTEESVKEFEAFILAQKERLSKAPTKLKAKDKLVNFAMMFTKKEFVKPVLITLAGFHLLEASGRHIFPAYATDILHDVIIEENRFYFLIGIDVIAIVSGIFANIIIKMFKRRTVLFSTGIISLILLLSISLYMFLISNGSLTNDIPWLLPFLLVLYFIFANFGCFPIPLILFGELFPMSYRGLASSITAGMQCILMTFAMKYSPIMFIELKIYGTFAILALILSLSLLYLYFTLPETRNRTLQEIENFFVHGQFLNDKISCQKGDDNEAKSMILNENIPGEISRHIRS